MTAAITHFSSKKSSLIKITIFKLKSGSKWKNAGARVINPITYVVG
jgi:hypothetical protein